MNHRDIRGCKDNMWGKVKDPALVASLTGHVEGSQAFSRYRDIDENIKLELVEMLDRLPFPVGFFGKQQGKFTPQCRNSCTKHPKMCKKVHNKCK